jgi:hydrogenase assembly chaperone HypC/HupF
MCISYPGRVVALEGSNAVVDTAGRHRRATTLLVPDAEVGDWVMVGAGSILRRLDAAEAAFIVRTLDVARATPAAPHLAQGGQP